MQLHLFKRESIKIKKLILLDLIKSGLVNQFDSIPKNQKLNEK